jgi:hypothetical protein
MNLSAAFLRDLIGTGHAEGNPQQSPYRIDRQLENYSVQVTFSPITVSKPKNFFSFLPNPGKLLIVYLSGALAGAIVFMVIAVLLAYPTESYVALIFLMGVLSGVIGFVAGRMHSHLLSRTLRRFSKTLAQASRALEPLH